MLLCSGHLTSTSKFTSTMKTYTIKTIVKMIEDLQVNFDISFERLEAFVQRLERNHPRANGNGTGPV